MNRSLIIALICMFISTHLALASGSQCEDWFEKACSTLDCLKDEDLKADERIALIDEAAIPLISLQGEQYLMTKLADLRESLEAARPSEIAYLKTLLDRAPHLPTVAPTEVSRISVDGDHQISADNVSVIGSDLIKSARPVFKVVAGADPIITSLIFESNDHSLSSFALDPKEVITHIDMIYVPQGSHAPIMLADANGLRKIYLLRDEPEPVFVANHMRVVTANESHLIIQADQVDATSESLFRSIRYEPELNRINIATLSIPSTARDINPMTTDDPVFISPESRSFYWLSDQGAVLSTQLRVVGPIDNYSFTKLTASEYLISVNIDVQSGNDPIQTHTQLSILDMDEQEDIPLYMPESTVELYYKLEEIQPLSNGDVVLKLLRTDTGSESSVIEWMRVSIDNAALEPLTQGFENVIELRGQNAVMFFGEGEQIIPKGSLAVAIRLDDADLSPIELSFPQEFRSLAGNFFWNPNGVYRPNVRTKSFERVVSAKIVDIEEAPLDDNFSLLIVQTEAAQAREAIYLVSRSDLYPGARLVAMGPTRGDWAAISTTIQELPTRQTQIIIEGGILDDSSKEFTHTASLYLLDEPMNSATYLYSVETKIPDGETLYFRPINLLHDTPYVYALKNQSLKLFRVNSKARSLVAVKIPGLSARDQVLNVSESQLRADGTISIVMKNKLLVLKIK